MAETTLAAEGKDGNNNEVSEERVIYPYPGTTKSKVWDFFGFYKLKEGPPTKKNLDMEHAVCRLCRKKYSNKGWCCLN
jgi:hypothetical protein